VPFDYYKRLSKKEKRIYDKSDELARVPLSNVEGARAATEELAALLATGDRKKTNVAAQKLVDLIDTDLGIERVHVKVLSRRPTSSTHELHGLYVREEGKTPIIRVWMRTAAHKAVVKPRTFVRTLLHEVCHHVDFTLFALDESFHTEGFFRRESDLVRRVLGPGRKRAGAGASERAGARARERVGAKKGEQLSLFG
jgi:hypothetical protein